MFQACKKIIQLKQSKKEKPKKGLTCGEGSHIDIASLLGVTSQKVWEPLTYVHITSNQVKCMIYICLSTRCCTTYDICYPGTFGLDRSGLSVISLLSNISCLWGLNFSFNSAVQ